MRVVETNFVRIEPPAEPAPVPVNPALILAAIVTPLLIAGIAFYLGHR